MSFEYNSQLAEREEQMEHTETHTVQPDMPGQPHFKPSFAWGGAFASCIFVVLWLAFVIFMVVLCYKFVKAHERIAKALENGIFVKKQEFNWRFIR